MVIIDRMEQEEAVLDRLSGETNKETGGAQETGDQHEAAEFVRLHSLLPFLSSKTVSQLDIVLEAITYIHMLQARLQGGGGHPGTGDNRGQ